MKSRKGKNPYFFSAVLLVGLSVLFFHSSAIGEGIGMVTGSKVGTYIQFGQNIAEISAPAGVDILVKESEGSIANIRRMNSKENAALGIVQSDVLGFLSRSNNVEMQKIANRIRMILPFYNEEVHLFANRDIQNVNDLQGKRVVIGKQGSGNWLTATNLMKIAGVAPAEALNLEPMKGVIAILEGKADAMFYVAGKPVKLFTGLGKLKENPKYMPLFDKVHFVSITDPDILKEYEASSIGPDDYPWLNSQSPTAAVKAVLVSFDFSSKSTPYYRQRCRELSILGKTIREKIDTLKEKGHPKWKEVELEVGVGLWEPDTCSRSFGDTSKSGVDITGELENALLLEMGK